MPAMLLVFSGSTRPGQGHRGTARSYAWQETGVGECGGLVACPAPTRAKAWRRMGFANENGTGVAACPVGSNALAPGATPFV